MCVCLCVCVCVYVCTCRRKIPSNGSSRFFSKKNILLGFSVLFAATSILGIRLTLRAPKICQESMLISSAARRCQPLVVARPRPDLGHPVQTFVWAQNTLCSCGRKSTPPGPRCVYVCVPQYKGRVGADSMSSLKIAVGNRHSSPGVGFENMRPSRVMK